MPKRKASTTRTGKGHDGERVHADQRPRMQPATLFRYAVGAATATLTAVTLYATFMQQVPSMTTGTASNAPKLSGQETVTMPHPQLIGHAGLETLEDQEALKRTQTFADFMARRRTVREFAPTPVPRPLIEHCLRAAGTSPSGANQQPWRFVAVSAPALKRRIREEAEAEERAFYAHRAPPAWLKALEPLGTTADKPFLEIAPWLIGVFYERTGVSANGGKSKRYYPHESVGIATGLLVAALHHAGLVSLTHTPSPMGFLNTLMGRPSNEMPFLLLAVGHAAPNCRVPDIQRMPLDAFTAFIE